MKSFGDRKFSSRTRHCNFEEVNKNITFGEPEMEHWNCGVNCSALLAVTTLILGVLLLVMKIIAPQVKVSIELLRLVFMYESFCTFNM